MRRGIVDEYNEDVVDKDDGTEKIQLKNTTTINEYDDDSK